MKAETGESLHSGPETEQPETYMIKNKYSDCRETNQGKTPSLTFNDRLLESNAGRQVKGNKSELCWMGGKAKNNGNHAVGSNP